MKDLDHAIRPGRGAKLVVRTECHGLHGVVVAREFAEQPDGLVFRCRCLFGFGRLGQFPQPQPSVVAAAQRGAAVGGECRSQCRGPRHAETRYGLAGPGVPQLQASIAGGCQQALAGAFVVAANGNRNAATDTAAGVELLLAGLRSAGLNVDVNIGSVTDASFTSRVAAERRELTADAEADAQRAREQFGVTDS